MLPPRPPAMYNNIEVHAPVRQCLSKILKWRRQNDRSHTQFAGPRQPQHLQPRRVKTHVAEDDSLGVIDRRHRYPGCLPGDALVQKPGESPATPPPGLSLWTSQ